MSEVDRIVFRRKVQVAGLTSLQVSVPQPIAEKLSVFKGEEVQIFLKNGAMIVKFFGSDGK